MKMNEDNQIVIELIEFVPNDNESLIRKTIIEKYAANISVRTEESAGEEIQVKSKYCIYTQLLEGRTQLNIGGNIYSLTEGRGLMIPASNSVFIKSKERCKIIMSIIDGKIDSKSHLIAV